MYKNSDYRIQRVNGKYGILHKPSGKYVDLVNTFHEWEHDDKFFKDCFGCAYTVVKVFKTKEINIEKTY